MRGGELEAARGGHRQSGAVGDDRGGGGAAQRQIDCPEALVTRGRIDKEAAAEQRGGVAPGKSRGPGAAAGTDPDDQARLMAPAWLWEQQREQEGDEREQRGLPVAGVGVAGGSEQLVEGARCHQGGWRGGPVLKNRL